MSCAFEQNDIARLRLAEQLKNDWDRIRYYLEHGAGNDGRFFAAGTLHSIDEVLGMAAQRNLTVQVVAQAIDDAGNKRVADALRAVSFFACKKKKKKKKLIFFLAPHNYTAVVRNCA
jgi:hypothetical protein